MRKESGFTLIELLIVLAILGILIGIVAMSVGNLTDTAKTRGQNAETEILQVAVDTYNTQDVIVDQGAVITARTTGAVVTLADADAPFTKYLKRSTKYEFTWGTGGISITCTSP